MRGKKGWCVLFLLGLLVFLIPIEHKYDKPLRFFSESLLPPGLPAGYDFKIFFYVSDLIALILTGVALARKRAQEFFLGPGAIWLWILLGLAAVSIAASPFIFYPLPYTRLLQLLTPIALFSFLAFGLTEEEKGRVQRAVWILLVLAALFQSSVAIGQYFTQESLGLRLLGESRLHPSSSACASLTISQGHLWLLDPLFSYAPTCKKVLRAYGTLPHPNVLGGFLVCSLIATYALWASTEKKRRWLWSAAIPLQCFALCLTYCRSALFAWAIASAIWFFLLRKSSIRPLVFWTLGSLMCSLGLLYNQYVERGGLINYTSESQRSDAGRFVYQNVAFRMIAAHPLTGVGYTQFSLRSAPYFPAGCDPTRFPSGAHNVYLFLATELGLPALVAFLLFIGAVLRPLPSLPKNADTISLIALFVGFLFIGCCDFYPILFQQGKLLFFLIAGLLVGNARSFASRNLENVQRPVADL